MRPALTRHEDLLRRCIEDNEGYVFKTVGDAFCAAFPTANDAVGAALAAQLARPRHCRRRPLALEHLWPLSTFSSVRAASL